MNCKSAPARAEKTAWRFGFKTSLYRTNSQEGCLVDQKYHRESMRPMEEPGHWRRTTLGHLAEVITREKDGNGISVPPPDVIVEILVRLPAKSIVRFRLVCKLWHKLTQEGHFIKRHLEHTPKIDDLGIIGVYWSRPPSPRQSFIHYYVNGFHEFHTTDLFRVSNVHCDMSNPCDGLVCVYEKRTICVVNPSIREVLVLPKPKYQFVYSIALGKNMRTGEYKVVRVFSRRDFSMGCEIFSLGSHSWRIVQDPPALIYYHVLPQFVNGTIYWMTHLRATPKMLASFDLEKETFDVIMQPVGLSRNRGTTLSVLEGHLCLTVAPAMSELTVSGEWKKFKKMWVLQDKDNAGNITWKELHISMRQIESFSVAYGMRPLTTMIGDDRKKKILWKGRGGKFFVYDVTSGRFTSTMREHNCCSRAYAYRESLVSPIAIQEKISSAPDGGRIVLERDSRGVWGQRLSCYYKRT